MSADWPPPIDIDESVLANLPRNDMGNGQRLKARFGHIIAFTPWIGALFYKGGRWIKDDKNLTAVRALAHLAVEAIKDREAPALRAADGASAAYAHIDWWHRSATSRGVSSMLREAIPHLVRPIDVWDADSTLLNVQNGTLEIHKGSVRFREARPEDCITLQATVDYDLAATCPVFREALGKWQPAPKVQWFLQRVFGACLTDSSKDQVMLFLHGSGGNGKSAFLEAVCGVLGDYAMQIDAAHLQRFRFSRPGPNPSLVRMSRRRLIRAAEPDAHAPLAESLIKQATGGEPIEVRDLYEKPREIRLGGRIVMSCNTLPTIRGTDEGIWRRICVIEWPGQFEPTSGTPIEEIFIAERAGILNWLLMGLQAYLLTGFYPVPEPVRSRTKDYRMECDSVGMFVQENCEKRPGLKENSADLYGAYERFCIVKHVRVLSPQTFAKQLNRMGFPRGGGGRTFRMGLTLLQRFKPVADEVDDAW